MSNKNEQIVHQSVEKVLEKTPVQVEVLELDEALLDIVSGGIDKSPVPTNRNCGGNFICW